MIVPEQKKRFDWVQVTLLAVTFACVVCVIVVMVIRAFFTPKQLAERTLNDISTEYYEYYLYPQLTDSGRDLTEVFAEYAKMGMPVTYLRQLLLYNESEHEADIVYFQNDKINCDTNFTGVRFIPKEPYGIKDYEKQFVWQCEEE